MIAADGPSGYDIGVGLVALAGLGLSACSLWRPAKRETRTVRVTCTYMFPLAEGEEPERILLLEVLNEGHRPVELEGVGFLYPDGSQPVIQPLLVGGEEPRFPRKLGDGETALYHFDLDEIMEGETRHGKQIQYAEARASGQRFRGDFLDRAFIKRWVKDY